jgi:phosphohistidine phosphatase
MMRRRLYLLRHAKSSWDDPALADRERPLNERGRRAAVLVAGHLERERIEPELIVCSPARRTLETLERVEGSLGDPLVELDERLYAADADELLDRLRELPDDVESVMLIGHNPGIHDLARLLTGSDDLSRKFPTAALATLSFDASWPELSPATADLAGFVRPKQLRGD